MIIGAKMVGSSCTVDHVSLTVLSIERPFVALLASIMPLDVFLPRQMNLL